MAALIVSKSGVTLTFGIGAGIAAITGFITDSDSQELASKTADALDSQGSTLAIAFYDNTADIKFSALVVSGTALPTPGSSVTVASSLVQSVSKSYLVMPPIVAKEKNNGFTMIEITLRRYLDNLIPS